MSQVKKQLLEQLKLLLESEDLSAITKLLSKQRSSDIAEVVETLDNEQRQMVFSSLNKEVSAEVLEKVDEATRGELFELLGDYELAKLVSELDPDDAADVLMELPEENITEFLESFPAAESAQIKNLMSYSEDSAGGIMDPVLISVPENATVAEAISKIRTAEIRIDMIPKKSMQPMNIKNTKVCKRRLIAPPVKVDRIDKTLEPLSYSCNNLIVIVPLLSVVLTDKIICIYKEVRQCGRTCDLVGHVTDVLQAQVNKAVEVLYCSYLYLVIEGHSLFNKRRKTAGIAVREAPLVKIVDSECSA